VLRRIVVLVVATFVVVWALASPASAQTIVTENGDAGALPSTAQVIPGAVDEINGTLATLDQEDVYRLCLAGGQTFSASTMGSDIADTQLFLFDASGHGVVANDDSAVTRGSASRS